MTIFVVNNARPHTGEGVYAKLLSQAALQQRFLNLIMEPNSDTDDAFQQSIFLPFSKSRLLSRWRSTRFLTSAIDHRLQKLYLDKHLSAELGNNRKSEGTIVHYSNPSIPPVGRGMEAVTIHDVFYLTEKQNILDPHRTATRRNFSQYRKFKNVIAASNCTRNQLISEGFAGRISVIRHAAGSAFRQMNDKIKARTSLGLPLDKFLILSVSSRANRKNLPLVKETLSLLGQQYKLVRVGESIGDDISFSGVSDEQLNLIYNACDVLLFPTLNEGFGLPVAEAFVAGLPVVASDIEIMQEITMGAAILTDNNSSKLKAAIKEAMVGRSDLAEKLERVRAYYKLERFRSEMKVYYERILDNA